MDAKDILNKLPEGSSLIGNNMFELNGQVYELKIEGTAEVIPGPVRQIIIDELVILLESMLNGVQAQNVADELSIKIMNRITERFDITPKG